MFLHLFFKCFIQIEPDGSGPKVQTRMNYAQRKRLLDIMEEHDIFLYGPTSSATKAKWQEVAKELNYLNNSKKPQEWKSSFAGMRSKVKLVKLMFYGDYIRFVKRFCRSWLSFRRRKSEGLPARTVSFQSYPIWTPNCWPLSRSDLELDARPRQSNGVVGGGEPPHHTETCPPSLQKQHRI